MPNIRNSPYRDKLAHLSNVEVNELMNRYYTGEKVADLIQEFTIDTQPSMLWQSFPSASVPEIACIHCKEPMVKDRQAKGSYNHFSEPYCPTCGCHYIQMNGTLTLCRCYKCNEIKENTLRTFFDNEKGKFKNEEGKMVPLEPMSLSLRDGVYLMTVIRSLAEENLLYVNPLNTAVIEIAPTTELSLNIIRHLWKNSLIFIHSNSPLTAFSFSEDSTEVATFNLEKCYWGLNLGESSSEILKNYATLEKHMEYLIAIDKDPYFEETDDEGAKLILDIARSDMVLLKSEVAFHECMQYLLYQSYQHGFNYKIGDKTKVVFEKLLDSFSVSQIYNFIWNSIKSATAFLARQRCSKAHAANIIHTTCRSQADKAISEGWDVKGYRRDFNCPRSTLSIVIYEQLLKRGDEGFAELLHHK